LAYFLARCYAEGLSKAMVTRSVGMRDGLSAERSYSLKTLPAGVARGVAAAVRGSPAELGRSAAIVAGLGAAGTGYCTGWVRRTGG
jgi:glucosyl-dolichyl phosphate glucuronosyltransferase